jgi:magnesium transporter
VVLKTARYDDASESVEFAELQLFIGASYVVTVRHGQASALAEVRRTIEHDLSRIRCGPMAVLHAVMDHVVDGYMPVMDGIDNDMAEIEDAVFAVSRPRGFDDPSQRIFKLKREVLDFYRHTEPLLEPLSRLALGQLPGAHPELGSYFRDVEDHLKRAVSAIAHVRDLLSDALDANLAQVTVRQNDDMRRISAWLAIGGFPTVVGAIYGMNFHNMPELDTRFGYYAVLVVMGVICFALWRRFKKIGWL